jgi:hypothetical protein
MHRKDQGEVSRISWNLLPRDIGPPSQSTDERPGDGGMVAVVTKVKRRVVVWNKRRDFYDD